MEARQCYSALCPYTLALYYLILGHPNLSPRLCCSAKHKRTCDLTDGFSVSSSQAVVVYVHSVCCSVCCAPSPNIHSVQRGAAHLPTELLHAVAQWISYPRYISFSWQLKHVKQQQALPSETGSDFLRITGNSLLINTVQACVLTDHYYG